MPETNITSTSVGDMTNLDDFDYSVMHQSTDGPTDQHETEYINSNWTKWYGYYKSIPELAAAINAIARWTVGNGFMADTETTLVLDQIRGWGKDTFNTLLENAIRTMYIGGDFFAEIIRNDTGELINIKPLSPDTVKIIVDEKGMLKRYEQISRIGVTKAVKKFKVEEILHFAKNRVADEIHGTSIVEVLENIILARNEAMTDMKTLMHRYVKPRIVWKLDTDDTTKIEEFKVKADTASRDAENLYIPKDAVEHEILAIPQNATMSPLPWIDALNRYFFQATGGTDIVLGGSGELTESTSKIKYLAFEQNIKEEQLFIEEQLGNQLGIEINLEFPASLENELLSDSSKDQGAMQVQPNDTTAGISGR